MAKQDDHVVTRYPASAPDKLQESIGVPRPTPASRIAQDAALAMSMGQTGVKRQRMSTGPSRYATKRRR